jgi:hypothetical protein
MVLPGQNRFGIHHTGQINRAATTQTNAVKCRDWISGRADNDVPGKETKAIGFAKACWWQLNLPYWAVVLDDATPTQDCAVRLGIRKSLIEQD